MPHIRVSESRWEDFIVNEKSLEVLKKYDLNIQRVGRGRGGMILSTDEGMRLFLECSHPDGFYFKEDSVTAVLGLSGFTDTDIYIRNEDGRCGRGTVNSHIKSILRRCHNVHPNKAKADHIYKQLPHNPS